MADEHDEDDVPVGDTDEVHDTLHPSDLPPGHPGGTAEEEKRGEPREAAADSAAGAGGIRD